MDDVVVYTVNLTYNSMNSFKFNMDLKRSFASTMELPAQSNVTWAIYKGVLIENGLQHWATKQLLQKKNDK